MFSVKPQDGTNLVIGTAKMEEARYLRHLETHQYNETELSLYLGFLQGIPHVTLHCIKTVLADQSQILT